VRQGLDARVVVERGGFTLDAELAIAPGEVAAVVGPNGAGKSLLVHALAGLAPLTDGRIELDGTVLADVAAGVHVGPDLRPIGVVFQDRLLFPHLSCLDNVAFGPRARGVPRREARRSATALLADVGLSSRAGTRPSELSGGEAQRVAIARALAIAPAALLLDEPLSALDAAARRSMRGELRRRLGGFGGCGLLVTHDLMDALGITDHVVVLEGGRVVQSGSVADVCARPKSSYVAEFVGVNLLRGHARAGRVELAGGGTLVAAGAPEGPVLVVVHPRAVALFRRRPDGTPRNVWRGTVASIDDEGDRARVRVSGAPDLVAEVTPAALHELSLSPGADVWVAIKATEVSAYADE
jgi:molybdate transport system ATP-binding protein